MVSSCRDIADGVGVISLAAATERGSAGMAPRFTGSGVSSMVESSMSALDSHHLLISIPLPPPPASPPRYADLNINDLILCHPGFFLGFFLEKRISPGWCQSENPPPGNGLLHM